MSKRILIVGRGTAGTTLAMDVTSRGGDVIGFLDDNADGDDVLGSLADVDAVVASHQVELIYFAIPTISAARVRAFLNTITSTTVEFAIIPRTYEILSRSAVSVDDLTDVDVLHLVGREPVKHDLDVARRFIAGKTVLITGAAGSIGSRLAKHLEAVGAGLVVCVDWWENGMFQLGRDLVDADNVALRIADVRDTKQLDLVFQEFSPELVFHAAAYKHVPLMQDNAVAAINNNVWGTLNVMRLAIEHRVDGFVYVSTDKAVNPVNVMGATKRLGEMVMESLASQSHSTRFTAVRFGNVIESNGSVMQIFRSQIARKLPLTVTHPDVTRFFMTIDEASQLIIQSATLGKNGEIYVLDMGEPVKILDLATGLVRATDPSLEIKIVGLRPGEKLYEELSYEPDKVERTENRKIFIVRGEREFDQEAFLASTEALVGDTLSYRTSDPEAVARLRAMGFQIQ